MALRKIATNLPEELLKEAVHLTGSNQTQTLIEGLRELIARKKREALLSLGGKLHLRMNTNESRQRRRT